MAFNFGASATTKPTLNFGAPATDKPAGLFSSVNQNQTQAQPATTQANQSSNLFGNLGAKPTTNLFGQSTTQQQPATANANQNTNLQSSTNVNASTLSSGAPQIDVAHIRSTTKYDHLTPQLQQEIFALDTAILNQIRQCTDVSDLLPSVIAAGGQTAPALEFVGTKLEELEIGLENDAEAVVSLRDGDVSKDEGEAKCVFRTVDRLKMPRQYQVGNAEVGAMPGAAFNGGLSGWWNQPQTFRGSSVRAAGAGLSVQLVDEDLDEDKNKGPKSLAELFNTRANEMASTSGQHTRLLGEIEDFVGGLEEKLYSKERDLNARLDTGVQGNGETGLQQEREHQMQLLRFVFGEVQRNLYEVAEKIGTTRDAVVDMSMKP